MKIRFRIAAALILSVATSASFAEETRPLEALAVSGRTTAVHFIPANGDEDFVKQLVTGAPTIAGVRHVFVRDGSKEEVARWGGQFADMGALVSYESASSITDLPAEEKRPSLVIFDASGKEVFRRDAGATRLNSGLETRELLRITSANTRADLNVKPGEPAAAGYDVVSYFHGKPMQGSGRFISIFEGTTYQFASAENLKNFAASPEAFAPAYGGWCAWAMLDGDKVEVDPETYKVADGRLLLYYNGFFGNTLKKWNKVGDDQGQIAKADTQWARLRSK